MKKTYFTQSNNFSLIVKPTITREVNGQVIIERRTMLEFEPSSRGIGSMYETDDADMQRVIENSISFKAGIIVAVSNAKKENVKEPVPPAIPASEKPEGLKEEKVETSDSGSQAEAVTTVVKKKGKRKTT